MPKSVSELEDLFAFQLKTAGIEFEQQVKFHPGRKFMADFFFRDAKLIVEINGGTWMRKSGHNTAQGIQRDYEKSNAAQLLGFTYLQYTKAELDNLIALDTVRLFVKGV